jgi:hypothetical protein
MEHLGIFFAGFFGGLGVFLAACGGALFIKK